MEFTPDPALSFWPTPDGVADDLVYWLLEPWHGLGDGVRVLEPSAGDGHLIRAIRERLPQSHITAVEPSASRAATLRALADVDVVESTLEAYQVDAAMRAFAGEWEPFHLVVMNPPFTLDGRPEAWAEHVLAIYHDPYLLAPGGVIGAVVPRIVMTGTSKRVRAVRDLTTECGGIEDCERDAFAPVGAQVSAALMWVQRPFDPQRLDAD
jgi:predicted RNA methylase